MPYYKGVYFEKAFHTEDDVAKHAAENPVESSEPVALPAAPPPAVEEPPPASEPELAVPVERDSDRKTPIVEVPPAIDAEPDPFPKFEPEAEPETQPEEADEEADEATGSTKDETPDAKKTAKKKKSGK